MQRRSWRWLRTKILGLLSVPVSMDVTGCAFAGKASARPVFATRLQAALAPSPDVREEADG